MSERIVYDCDGVGCESMAEDTLPQDWLILMPVAPDEGVTARYTRHFCKLECVASWAQAEAHLAELRVTDTPNATWSGDAAWLPTIGQGSSSGLDGMSVRAYFHRQNTTQQDD